MNAKRMQFGLIALAVYTAIGLFGAYTAPPTSDSIADTAADAKSRDAQRDKASGGGAGDGFNVSIELHSLLPGSLK